MAKIKKTLNDQNIKGLEPAPKGTRYDAWDVTVPGLSVRVTDNGAKTFSLTAKLFNEATSRRFTIDKVGAITLADARDTARSWLNLISDNKDPRTVVAAERAGLAKEVEANEANRFCTLLTDHLAIHEKAVKPEYHRQQSNYLKRNCLPIWKDRQLASITSGEIGALVRKVRAASGDGAGVAMFKAIKSMFGWAAGIGITDGSAAESLIAKKLLGEKNSRERVLEDHELKAIWNVVPALKRPLPLPLIAVYRMLILTGCRKNEIAGLHEREIDRKARTITIPAKRMKMKKTHIIPLTDMMIEVLDSVGHNGGYVFSVNGGKSPIRIQTKYKADMDAASGVKKWHTHDLRHTVRTLCAPRAMGIPYEVCDLMIAHTKKGYNHHDYLDEKRDGFERWNAKVAEIVGRRARIRLVA